MDEVKLPPSRQRAKGVSLRWKWKNPWVSCDMCGETVARTSGVQKHCPRCGIEAEQANNMERFRERYRTDPVFRQHMLDVSRAWKKRTPGYWRRYYSAEKQRQRRARKKLRHQVA